MPPRTRSRTTPRTLATFVAMALLAAGLAVVGSPAQAAPAALDPSFGRNGLATVERRVTGLATSGTRTYVGTHGSGAVTALDAVGGRDAAFGGGTVTLAPSGTSLRAEGTTVAVDSEGRLVASIAYYDDQQSSWSGFDLVRLLPNGELDPSWGGSGRVMRRTPGAYVGAEHVLAGGGVVVNERDSRGGFDRLVRYLSDGSVDVGFGTAGTVELPREMSRADMVALPDGGLLVLEHHVAGGRLTRYTAQGQVDTSFGTGGSQSTGQATGLWRLSSGRLLVASQGYYNGTPSYWDSPAKLHAYTAAGEPDRSFGTAGSATVLGDCLTQRVSHVVEDLSGALTVVLSQNDSCSTGAYIVQRLPADGGESSFIAADVDSVRPQGVTKSALRADGTVLLGGYPAADSRSGTVAALRPDIADRTTRFVPVTPARLLDTRDGTGRSGVSSPVGPGGTVVLDVAGRGGLPPSGVRAVVLNVTAVTPSAQTHVTVYPSGQAPPDASNLNALPGGIVPNQVVVRVGADGRIVLRNAAGNAHLVADVSGYYTAAVDAARFSPLPPVRLLDTRDGTGGVPSARVGADSTLTMDLRGRGGIPASGVRAVVLNVTAVNASTPGVVTVHPASAPLPLASNINTRPGGVFPNLVTVAVPADGRVSFWNSAGTVDLIADVAGWYGAGADSSFVPLSPVRLLDSREDVGDFGDVGARLHQDEVWELDVAAGGVASGASAVALNVTSVLPTEPTVLTLYPSDLDEPPLASNLNPTPSAVVVAGAVLARTSSDTYVSVWNAWGSTHLVVDVNGYFVT